MLASFFKAQAELNVAEKTNVVKDQKATSLWTLGCHKPVLCYRPHSNSSQRAISCAAFVGSLGVIRRSVFAPGLNSRDLFTTTTCRAHEPLRHKALFPVGMARTLARLPSKTNRYWSSGLA